MYVEGRRLSLVVPGAMLWFAIASTTSAVAQSKTIGLEQAAASMRWLEQGTLSEQRETKNRERRFDLTLHDATLKDALRMIEQKAEVALFYNDRDITAARYVSVSLHDVTAMQALGRVLEGTSLAARPTPAGIVINKGAREPPADALPDTTGSISGVVSDSTTGTPIAGATIEADHNGNVTRSDDGGRYRLDGLTAGPHSINVRRLGYVRDARQVTVAAGGSTTANFALAPVPRVLDKMVTTATGVQRVRQLGNAIANVRVDSLLATAPVNSLSEVLSARIPGVGVYSPGGVTGASPRIDMRGQNSISLGTQPLLYVDGVRVENSAVGAAATPALATSTSGRFNDISLDDIQAIEVVRGPSAATLYGTDAANGVILIRTKRGTSGRPEWRVHAERGLLTYDRNRFKANYVPWGHSTSGASTAARCPLLSVAAGSCVQDSVRQFSPLLDPSTTPIGQGHRSELGAQVVGGTTSKYLLSAQLVDEIGYLRMPDDDRELLEAQRGGRALSSEELHPNGLRRLSMRANLDVPVAENADISVSTSMSRQRSRIPPATVLVAGATSLGIRDAADGWRTGSRPGDVFIRRHEENVTRFTGGLTARWRPWEWLTFRATGGFDFSSGYLDQLARAGEGFTSRSLNGVRDNTKVNTSLETLDLGATSELEIASGLTSRSSIGVQYSRRAVLSNKAAAQQLTPGSESVAGGAVLLTGEGTEQSVVAGTYFEETVGFRDRVFLTGAVRVDGSSAFGEGFRAALYPKAAISWIISDESSGPRIPLLRSLRLRAAYGQSGVQPGPVDALASESLFPAFVDNASVNGAGLGAIGNRNLKPERQREFEFGADAEALDGRLSMALTAYDKRSTDALVSVPLPSSFGGGTQWANVGSVRNRGFEGTLTARILDGQALHWDITLNGSVNDNKVLAVAPDVDAIYGIEGPSIVKGYPLWGYFVYPITGYGDSDGDGIIEADEVTVGNEKAYRGRSYPHTQLSAISAVRLLRGKLGINATLTRSGGFRLYNGAMGITCFFDACAATAVPGAPLRLQAAAVAFKTPQLLQTFDGFIEDASFTRLREVAVSYTLPAPLVRRLAASGATITLAGRNLALWTNYSGPDPEVQSQFGGPSDGPALDLGGIPSPQYWLLRVSVTF
jgi:TonB-linked SusC/RagA family outer membrane protein